MKKSKNIIIYLLLLLFLLIKIFYLLDQKGILWDSAVYIGMGKYLFSLGNVGLWEPARPLVLPFFLGLFWKLGFNAVIFGRILEVGFSAGCLCLTYLIGKNVFNEKIGLLSAFLLAFSPSFLFYSSTILTGIPSTFFALLSVYFLIKKNYFFSGLFVGLSFMTRFLQLFVLLVIVLYVMYGKRKIENLLRLGYGFSLIVVPYLIFNTWFYKNPIYPLILQMFMSKYTGWVYHEGIPFYFINLLKENFLLLFSIVGVVVMLIKIKSKQMVILGIFLLFFVFFNSIAHKEIRFILTFLPYMYMVASYGILKSVDLMKKEKNMFGFVVFICIVIWFFQVATQFEVPIYKEYPEFTSYLDSKGVEGGLWISNPLFVVNSDIKIDELIYYPLYNSKRIAVLKEGLNRAEYVLIDTCDILPCYPSDNRCISRTNEFLGLLKDRFELVHYKKDDKCEEFIFS